VTSAIELLETINLNANSAVSKLEENKLVIDDNKTTLTNKTNEITTLIKENNNTLSTSITDGFVNLNTKIDTSESSIKLTIETNESQSLQLQIQIKTIF